MTQEKAIQEAKLKECFMNVAEKHQKAMQLYFNSHILPVIYDAMLEYSKSASSGEKGFSKNDLFKFVGFYIEKIKATDNREDIYNEFLGLTPKEHSEGEGNSKMQEIKVCTGCGHFSDDKIEPPHLGCCPDNNHISTKEYIKILEMEIKELKDRVNDEFKRIWD